MAKRTGLRLRLEKLEERRRTNRRPLPRVVLLLHNADDAHIIGFIGGNVTVLRGDNEQLDDLRERACALTSSATIVAKYAEEAVRAAAEAVPQLSSRPSAPEASDAPTEAPSPIDDYWALAGIGREATPEELWHAGAIRGPFERLR